MSIVLVVDDEDVITDVLSAALSDEGHDALIAGHGHHALDQLERNPHTHLVICDFFMPKLNGAGLLRAMREHEHHRTIPFILMSTMPENFVRQLVAAHTAFSPTAFLRKPFALAAVIVLVTTVLRANPREYTH